uniref:Vacuolar protein sorting-associated protein 13C n=1 Tax=Magallana gigas TaxID=29159 RepID=K1QCU7_MAGGI
MEDRSRLTTLAPGRFLGLTRVSECDVDTGITQAPAVPVQQTYTFNLKYKAEVDCDNMKIRNQIEANILETIRAHLRKLVKRFVKLCRTEISKCFASIEVKIKNCRDTTTRKRATAPSTIDVELNIPDLGETVTDSSKDVELQTEAVLQEDLDTQKAEYTPQGFTLDGSSFVGKYVTCTVGYISTNNNQSCGKNQGINYKATNADNGEKSAHVLNPMECVLYTWENAIGKRELEWSSGEVKSQKTSLIQDGTDSFFLDSDTKIFWVSFLDGLQRVLLFTEDLAVAINAQEAGELERIEQEINLSGVIWEEKKKRYKALNGKTTGLLEAAYQKYVMEIELGHRPPEKIALDNKMEVNFQEMRMIKPNNRGIRRSFQDGVWIQYKTSPHQLQVHAKINRLQLDNQTYIYVFPTVLAPIPPPKSVASDSVPKPFAEVSILSRKHEHSNMQQFKYFKVLVQEMSLKVDQGFLNNIIDFFTSSQQVSRDQEKEMLEADLKTVYTELLDEAGLSLAEEQKNFFDYLHFSPIKIHLSFSLQGGGGGDGKAVHLHANIINVFLQSVGVVLTDVQDVVFKLGFFERKNNFYNQSQLTSEMGRHYAGQAVKQLYVLVLGLDVLGNPFGLLRGMAEGMEDLFYEPYQGAIQGPEEFAEGLALGVRSLLGHAVGGAAGAVSRITGTIGKGLAALTFDDEYQKKRREGLNKKPANIGEGFARGGKGLVMGVFDGVTGIVRKPIEGAQKEGVEGFFKGIGKGLVGVVTRPTSGVIDFASSSFEGIKRIAELSDDVGRLRPPRRFHSDKIIRPYSLVEASGYAILQETEKGKRVIYANKGDIFGHWDAEWSHTWSDLKEKPKRSAKGVEFLLKDDKKKKFPFSLGGSAKKIEVHIPDPKRAEWLVGKISEAMEIRH